MAFGWRGGFDLYVGDAAHLGGVPMRRMGSVTGMVTN